MKTSLDEMRMKAFIHVLLTRREDVMKVILSWIVRGWAQALEMKASRSSTGKSGEHIV